MTTDDELDAAVSRSLGRILAAGDPYTTMPLVDPDTALLPPPTVEALTTTVVESDQLSAAFGGADVDLSSGDVTLTTAPRVAHLTGATAAREVTFPDTFTTCLVDNDTDYDITLTRAGGGSITVLSGATVEIVGA